MNNIKGITITNNASLKNYNTYKIESTTKYLIEVASISGLIELLNYLKTNHIPFFFLGNGSNLILDDYFAGAVIKLSGLTKISIEGEFVKAEACATLGAITLATLDHNLTGFEWAINIPGTLGGSLIGNAGAYNSEIFDNLVVMQVLTPDLTLKEITKDDIFIGYRFTNLKELGYIVLSATFKLSPGNKEESLALIKERFIRREKTQPLDLPSAGSVFQNPLNDHAGRLIEAAGLKGKQIGGAQVSTKHANFIVNTGTATSQDIKNLIKLIQQEVKRQFNVDLVLEQEIIDWK